MSAPNLPQWKCHKVVRAAKISGISKGPYGLTVLKLELGGQDDAGLEIQVSSAFMTKHAPYIGGYLVDYIDGYKSFSPVEAFEAGYTCLPDGLDGLQQHQQRVVIEASELDDRIARLTAFIKTDTFNGLPSVERGDLELQLTTMWELSRLLLRRIVRFKA